MKKFKSDISGFVIRGRSQTTFTRGGGYVGGYANRLFVNIYTIENVNGGG